MPSSEIKYRNLVISSAPHIHEGRSYSGAMYTFIIALLPAVIFAISRYGMDAARVIAVSIASAMASEYIIQKLFRKPVAINDGNALLMGLLMAFILPPSVPWWLIVVGCFFSILVGKQIFGGRGGNTFHPVLLGWVTLRFSWADYINYSYGAINYTLNFSVEYPLHVLKKSGAAAVSGLNYLDLFLGNQVGGTGASAVLLILIGGLFLIARGVISWRIPFSYLAGVAATASVFWLADSAKYADPLFHIVVGNVMIGAFFFATDYSSSPANKTAMLIFGFGCGLFTVLFRILSNNPNGVFFAILFMNILFPLLDKIRPAVPGKVMKEA
ncbi:MAG: hypothetical protein A2W19_01680 [Spirochaetes bacterium RBG_16_49_21]|nr:MAG: hypothetical protein A2W19_01680 [Spirochaetes bacterium RBG_16_49_21]